MQSKIGIIIRREFMERVGKKSFIITTLLMPAVMLVLMVAPTLIMMFSTPTERTFAVIDHSGIIMPKLEASGMEHVKFEATTLPMDSLLAQRDHDGILTVNSDVVANPKATLYFFNAGSMEVEGEIQQIIKNAVEAERLKDYNIENLDEIMKEISVTTPLSTVRVDESGDETQSSSFLSFGLGFFMAFILYMFLLMYGQMVMTSIIEEKNNRVLELVVTSVKPMQLMLGKIFGVALVAVVQVVIWGVLMCCISAFLLPLLTPESVASEISMLNAGTLDASAATTDIDMLTALSVLGSVGYIAKIFCYLLLYLVGGFLFYASIFAAIGSAVDNIQDASQLTSLATVPIIVAFVFIFAVANDPNSTLAFWLSMIPFTSPLVMLIRIPFDIPAWEVVLSVAVLYLSFVGMAWIAAKIYRVGIFMHGKKPTIKDLVRWARYK